MNGDDASFWHGGDPEPDDLALAWDAMDRHAVRLLWQALPEVRPVQPPGEELAAAADVIRSNRRKWPYRQLARRAWRHGRPPAGDMQLWLDAAGAMATMDNHLDTDVHTLGVLAVLRPADWTGAVIGLVRAGIGVPVTSADLVRYVRECPEVADRQDPGPGDQLDVADDRSDAPGGGARGGAGQDYGADMAAYDPFASATADDQALLQAFEAALYCWEALGAVSDQWWLTRLGWWGLPRALARAWNGDFDAAKWAGPGDLPQGTWRGWAVSPDELGIHRPPPVY